MAALAEPTKTLELICDVSDPAAIAGAATKPAPECRPFMKITIGSVDGLGDFVLRLPLVEALIAAGHPLQLVMRPPAADLARELFPETEVLVLERDPFRAETKKQRFLSSSFFGTGGKGVK
jgi:hypothetical protein